MCNLPFDPKLDSVFDAKEDSMYNTYLSSTRNLLRTDPPDWQSYMSDVDDQESNPNCGVYLYRLKAISLENNGVFEKTAKLILAK